MTYSGSVHSRKLIRSLGHFPTKLYIFRSALTKFQDKISIEQYLLESLNKHREIAVPPHLYAIAMVWGGIEDDKPIKAIDIFSYKFKKPWKWDNYNPVYDRCVVKNGIEDPMDREVTCETGSIILGREGGLRRTTKDLEQFLHSWPDIGDLGPVEGR